MRRKNLEKKKQDFLKDFKKINKKVVSVPKPKKPKKPKQILRPSWAVTSLNCCKKKQKFNASRVRHRFPHAERRAQYSFYRGPCLCFSGPRYGIAGPVDSGRIQPGHENPKRFLGCLPDVRSRATEKALNEMKP